MSEESKIKATQLLSKQERAAARRQSQELKKILKAKELYTKHFSGSPENPIYKERKTCNDVFFFPVQKDEESISEEKKVDSDLVTKIQCKQAKAAVRREEVNQKKIQSAKRFVRQVSHDQDKVSNPISKLNFNPVYDDCKHTVIRFRTNSFDETPVKGMQKCSALHTKVIVHKKIN